MKSILSALCGEARTNDQSTPAALPPLCPIKFPMVKERTGLPRGPRFRLRPDKSGLSGAAACTAGMIALAMNYRDAERRRVSDTVSTYDPEFAQLCHRIARWQVRNAALWARRFSRRIAADDPRFVELDRLHDEHRADLAAHGEKLTKRAA
jgi:hypothetical protein